MKEKSKILGTFPDTFFKMATDIIFHRFWVDLDSILGCFLGLKSEKWLQKNTAKTYLQKSHERDPRSSGTGSCGPLKQSKDPRSQDWEPIEGLETLHWCLAARWRIKRPLMAIISPLMAIKFTLSG